LIFTAEIGGDLVPPVLSDAGDPQVLLGNFDPGLVPILTSFLSTVKLAIRSSETTELLTKRLRSGQGISVRRHDSRFEAEIYPNDRMRMIVRLANTCLYGDRDEPLIRFSEHPGGEDFPLPAKRFHHPDVPNHGKLDDTSFAPLPDLELVIGDVEGVIDAALAERRMPDLAALPLS
jgi:hypothetical protein